MYNPKNAKEGKDATQLKPDCILDAVIVNIDDGVIKNFIQPGIDWKGDKEGRCINISMDVKNGEEIVQIQQLLTYKEENGQTIYTPKSNMGKFFAKYKKLPEHGDQVKIITNSDGFGKIKLD